MPLKTVYRLFRYIVVILASIFLLLLVVINLPPGRRFITSKINAYFANNDIPAHVERVSLLLNGKIRIVNASVINPGNDTLLFAGDVRVSVSPVAFLFRKIKAASISLDNCVVNLAVIDTSGQLNLLALFQPSEKPETPPSPQAKKWDIIIGSLSLKHIRLAYSDTFKGLAVYENLKDLQVRFSNFSTLDKNIRARYLRFNHSQTIIAMGNGKNEPLKAGKQMEIRLEKGMLNDISVQSNNASSPMIPLSFDCKAIKLVNASFNITGSEGDNFSLTNCYANIENICLSDYCSGMAVHNVTFNLSNGVHLANGDIVLESDTSHTVLKATLATDFSHVELNLKSGSGNKKIIQGDLFNLPFELEMPGSRISSNDIFAFMPGKPLKNNESISIGAALSGTLQFMHIRHLDIGTPLGLKIRITGTVSDLSQLSAARMNINLQTGLITPQIINSVIQLTGTKASVPSFTPVSIQAAVRNGLMSPEYEIHVRDSGANLDITAHGRGIKPSEITADVKMHVDAFGYKGYTYHSLEAEVTADSGNYAFHIRSSDPSAQFNLTGDLSFTESMKGDISGSFNVFPAHLNLFKDSISMKGFLDMHFLKSESITDGSVEIQNLQVRKNGRSGFLKRTALAFHTGNILTTARVEGDFISADFRSRAGIEELTGALKNSLQMKGLLSDSAAGFTLPVLTGIPETTLNLDALYHPVIGLFVADSVFSFHHVSLRMNTDPATGTVGTFIADQFRLNGIKAYSLHADVRSSDVKTILQIKSDSVRTGKTGMGESIASLSLDEDSAAFNIRISGKDNQVLYDIAAEVIKKDHHIELLALKDNWILNGNAWTVSPREFLNLDPDLKDFTANIHWINNNSRIDISGSIQDTIKIDLTRVEIRKLLIPGIIPYDFTAVLDGRLGYGGRSRKTIEADMHLLDMKLAEESLGDVSFKGKFTTDTLGMAEGELKMTTSRGGSMQLSANLGKNTKNRVHSAFENISLGYAQPFLSSYVNGLNGNLSGEINISDLSENPVINGQIQVKETGFRILPLQASFTIPGDEIEIRKSILIFKDFTILDSLKKRLNMEGHLDLSDTKNMKADLNITSDNLQVMHTTEKDNPSFFGSIFIDSKLRITGNALKPSITGAFALAKGTIINYRYFENLTVSEAQKMVTFTRLDENPADMAQKLESSEEISSSPYMEASIEIDPNTIFNFEINRGFAIDVKITGGGFLNYALLPNNTMNLSGRYEIRQGSSDLKITGWPRKSFIITPGSYLQWDGRMDDPELRIETISKVRGSYFNPVDNRNREVDFNVVMRLSNRLSQLEIVFDVSSDDQYITSVISSLSKDERTRQAINLLVFKRIELPNMISSSPGVSQQISQFWESQLNRFTKSTFKNVDVSFGLNTYKGTTESGGEQEYTSFTYQVKKDLFKNRGSVMVSGRMNDNNTAANQSNNMIENFTFEYALDTNRSKFLKIYRQQNYEDLLEGEVIKSGVGFIYRKKYDRVSDIWRRKP